MTDPQDDIDCPEPKDRDRHNLMCKGCTNKDDCEKDAHREGKCWEDCIYCFADEREHKNGLCLELGIECRFCDAERMRTKVDCES